MAALVRPYLILSWIHGDTSNIKLPAILKEQKLLLLLGRVKNVAEGSMIIFLSHCHLSTTAMAADVAEWLDQHLK
jgi:hypothetical protein